MAPPVLRKPSEREYLVVGESQSRARSRGKTQKRALSMASAKRQRTSTLARVAPGHTTSDGRPLQPARAHSASDTDSDVVPEAQPDGAQSSQPGHTCSINAREVGDLHASLGEMDDLYACFCDLPEALKVLVLSHIEHIEPPHILSLSLDVWEALSLLRALQRTSYFEGAPSEFADNLVCLLDDRRVRSLGKERVLELIGLHKDRLCDYACGRNFEVLKWAHRDLDLPWAPYPAGHVSDEILVLRVLKRVWHEALRPEHWRGVLMRSDRVVKLVLDGLSLTGAVPGEVGRLSALNELNLNHNQLTSLPAEIGQLTSLEMLCLDGNQLTSLPAEIGQLTSLEWLGLGRNQLTSVPAEIGQLTSLTALVLDGNRLTSLPAEIGQLTSLRELLLGGNQLASVPAEIGQLTSLKLLDLDGNQLTSVPAAISELRSAGCYMYMDVGVRII